MGNIAVKNASTVTMPLTQAELKFLLRMRQLRKQADVQVILVTVNPLTISVMGQVEALEPPTHSSNGAEVIA
jgi:hypothetical protein